MDILDSFYLVWFLIDNLFFILGLVVEVVEVAMGVGVGVVMGVEVMEAEVGSLINLEVV